MRKVNIVFKNDGLGKQIKSTNIASKFNILKDDVLETAPDLNVLEYPDWFKPIVGISYGYHDYEFGYDTSDNDKVVILKDLVKEDGKWAWANKDDAPVDVLITEKNNIITYISDRKVWEYDIVNQELLYKASANDTTKFRKAVYCDECNSVYIVANDGIWVWDGENLTQGIQYETNDYDYLRDIIYWRGYVIVVSLNYSLGKSRLLWWDRNTASSLWDKITIINGVVNSIGIVHNNIYIIQELQVFNTHKYLFKYYNGNDFVTISEYVLFDSQVYIDFPYKQFNHDGFIGSVIDYDNKELSGFIFFRFDGVVQQYFNLFDDNVSVTDFYYMSSHQWFAYTLRLMEVNDGDTIYYYRKFVVDNDNYNLKSIYITKFYNMSDYISDIVNFEINYLPLSEQYNIKVFYRYNFDDDWKLLGELDNNFNNNNLTIKNIDLTKFFNKIQFKFEFIGRIDILDASFIIKEIYGNR